MSKLRYMDDKGTFRLTDPDLVSYLYFPLCNEAGTLSSVTPDLNGDLKTGQDTFLLEPVSVENLHNNKSSRNFWVYVKNKGAWSVTGKSAAQQAKRFTEIQNDETPDDAQDDNCPADVADKPNRAPDKTNSAAGDGKFFANAATEYASDGDAQVTLTAGILWHRVERVLPEAGLKAAVTTFVPYGGDQAELTKVEITNITDDSVTVTPTAAIPLYARSASNIRDHRHVTSLLNRTQVVKNGVIVCPTLTFDERGHRVNHVCYGALCAEDDGGDIHSPEGFCPVTEEFIGEGGSFEQPYTVIANADMKYNEGDRIDGFETVAAMRFRERTFKPAETATYLILLGFGKKADDIERMGNRYLNRGSFDEALKETNKKWQDKINIRYHSADRAFDNWMHWVNFQPVLRRIYGCSFLPYHDYGKGGRGWRDLWQDCLALLLMDPEPVRGMLLDNFAGVRLDGTNATIIGSKQGEFIADRNNITRVWMDHGAWPYLTVRLYLQLTGDIKFLTAENAYFKDAQICRGEKKDAAFDEKQGNTQLDRSGRAYRGTVLEHLLTEHLTAFYDVGAHNHIRLRGADWNDGLDMAEENGESVAFTALYGGNLKELARDIRTYEKKTGNETVELAEELMMLLEPSKDVYDEIGEKNKILSEYCEKVAHANSGKKVAVKCDRIAETLDGMSEWTAKHIRESEWTGDGEGNGWFNGYYDNHGRAVEGVFTDNGLEPAVSAQGDGARNAYPGQSVMNASAQDDGGRDLSTVPELETDGFFPSVPPEDTSSVIRNNGSNGRVRMMLTSQVFAIMCGAATDDQVRSIIRSADRYLYDERRGGYRLNTDFEEVKTDLGRMFGFAYGHKENGAVFSHMTVMYANALYRRGFVKEGYGAIRALYLHCADFDRSGIYPGLPEYINSRGRGMYTYLTGSASWLLLTVFYEMYGIRPEEGDLTLSPKLLAEQFDRGKASVSFTFRGVQFEVEYVLSEENAGEGDIFIDGSPYAAGGETPGAKSSSGESEKEDAVKSGDENARENGKDAARSGTVNTAGADSRMNTGKAGLLRRIAKEYIDSLERNRTHTVRVLLSPAELW